MHGPTDPQLQEILRAGVVNDAMVGSPLERVSSMSSALAVEVHYTSVGSMYTISDVRVSIANGVFVDGRDVAAYLWKQFQGSAAHEEMDGEALEFSGKIEKLVGQRDTHYFVLLSNGPTVKNPLRLRVSSDGVATVGAGTGYTVPADKPTMEKIADDLAMELSSYVVDKEVGC